MFANQSLPLSPDVVLRVIGMTDLLPSEVDTPSFAPWNRALALAEANARTLAAALRIELGPIRVIEQLPESSDTRLVIAASFGLAGDGGTEEPSVVQQGLTEDSVLRYVAEDVRPLYESFRERVLALEPTINPAAAPLRKGKRRYEGFRLYSRNIIYASFRKHAIRLMFELPKGHGLPDEDFVSQMGRDWRVVMLTSPTQLEGAVALAEDTVRALRA